MGWLLGSSWALPGGSWDVFGSSEVLLGGPGRSLRALGCSLGLLGCFSVILGSSLEGCCKAWGLLLGAISYQEALEFFNNKTRKVAENMKKCNKHQKCCCNQQTGGVPLPFAHSGDIILTFTHNTNGCLMI